MTPVSISVESNVAIVTVDNPPVNAAGHAVRQGLVEAVEKTENNDAVASVVLVCAGRTFIAGADVREFGKPPMEPHLPDVVRAIEQSAKPWIAAIHGTALGGGLELALGCDYRIAVKSAKLGFPEVNLGLIPGAGGTVRLPRLVSAETALEMISSGKPVSATAALASGLVDQLCGESLKEEAKAFAKTAGKRTALFDAIARQPIDTDAWQSQADKTRSRARGQQSIVTAIDAVEYSMANPAPEALRFERDTFTKLKSNPQSLALRHIFFAERSATRLPELKGVQALPLQRVGIVGGGTMGSGIASACLLAGLSVTLVEQDTDAVDAATGRVHAILENAHARKLVTDAQLSAMQQAFNAGSTYAMFADADVVIEAVFEDMDIKRDVFSKLDAVAKPAAVLASNTSYLDIDALAATTAHPERVIGLHFFSPAHIMKLLEIVVTDKALPEVLATGFALGKQLNKITVPSGVCDGFIGNRVMSAYRTEADYLLRDGALPAQVDAAMKAFGYAMGIFEMQDLAGLDIAWAMRKRRAATHDGSVRYVGIADALCEAGRFGRKTGSGWYRYDHGKTAVVDEYVTGLVEQSSKQAGIARRIFNADEIMHRLLGSMQKEAEALLAEGIARSAEAIDVVMINGYGFPRWRGGPMFMQTAPD